MNLFALVTVGAMLSAMNAFAGSAIHDIPLRDIDQNATTLGAHKGKVLLVVNVASKCGLTPQYKALEALYQRYRDQGLVVCGFPCNQFGGQEPGTNAEIKEFCSLTYRVTFPMYDKIEVNGPNRHPLYVALAGDDSPFAGQIKWNFTKFVVGRDGRLLNRFDSRVAPDAPEVVAAIEAALAQ